MMDNSLIKNYLLWDLVIRLISHNEIIKLYFTVSKSDYMDQENKSAVNSLAFP